jgi:hypothetical protein
MEYSYSDPAVAAFVVIPGVLAALLVWGTASAWRHSRASAAATATVSLLVAAAAAGWMAATWRVAASGVLRDWNRNPPPFFFLVLAIVALASVIAFSGLGRRLSAFLPLWVLVAVQGFRLPLEVAMHAMYERGIMPREMTYTGRNFDILTGAGAIVVAALVVAGFAGRRAIAVWNVAGLALLVNVVTVAILATPRFDYFGTTPLNVWVTYPPFVWLPAVMVLAAFAGHLIVFRSLRSRR